MQKILSPTWNRTKLIRRQPQPSAPPLMCLFIQCLSTTLRICPCCSIRALESKHLDPSNRDNPKKKVSRSGWFMTKKRMNRDYGILRCSSRLGTCFGWLAKTRRRCRHQATMGPTFSCQMGSSALWASSLASIWTLKTNIHVKNKDLNRNFRNINQTTDL